MPDIYVVDTGTFEVYVFADGEAEACEQVCEKLGLESVKYAEFYSDDVDDIGRIEDLLE